MDIHPRDEKCACAPQVVRGTGKEIFDLSSLPVSLGHTAGEQLDQYSEEM